MKLMAYNIFEGGAGRIDPLAEVIRLAQADVIIIAEAWDEFLFHKLADRLHMDRFLADSPTNPKGATGLLTRLPIIEAVNHAPLDPRLTRSACHAILQTSTTTLPLIGLHLHARETLADESLRLTELPALFDIAQQFGDRPHLLAGDFNASHPQQPIDFHKLRPKTQARLASQNNEIPRDVIRTLLEHGYLDAHALHHPPADFHTSFTTSHPATRVDYLFVTPTLAPHVTSCQIFKPEMAKYASDHYPLLAEINI
jgi:exodeoxyribonuclease III